MAASNITIDVKSIEDFEFEVCKKFGVDELKPAQKEALKHLLSKNNVLAILPTGFGKSLIYQMYPCMIKEPGSVVIVSPLVSLMKDQISTLTSKGFSAEMVSNVKSDQDLPTYLFGSPEEYLKGKKKKLCRWGEKPDDSKKSRRKTQQGAFREYFSHVAELRSVLPDVTVLALTSTASKSLQSQLKDSLIIPDCKTINACPNRENIRLSVIKTPRDIASTFFWTVDKLREEKDTFPRTIIYCSSIDATGALFHYFKEDNSQSVLYMGMYHSETDSVVQESHLKEMAKMSNSNLRLMFCTTALCMGIDIKTAHHVLHFGPSFDIESYIQESGRVGRDNEPSHAVLFYHGGMLREICPKLKKYIINETVCRRVNLFKDFASNKDISDIKNKKPHHRCCDICEKNCQCGHCVEHANYFEKHMIHYCAQTDSEEESDDSTSSLEADAIVRSTSESSSSDDAEQHFV
ncbi:uncharacterized protein LOC102804141 [Saccoglossus kowalevskii]|uniref:DNA 3'-5' helicase n=1 Tax=Saccoglossus kowalevskii TaxID=10224 RepID=A0ABM0LU03_SACKO|nr:PREDICTED: mediator of RNA polymerase II transcription subunit 34-like [Saccoglossus kowalevskii]